MQIFQCYSLSSLCSTGLIGGLSAELEWPARGTGLRLEANGVSGGHLYSWSGVALIVTDINTVRALNGRPIGLSIGGIVGRHVSRQGLGYNS